MRHSYLLFGLLSLVAVSCSMTEIDVPDRTSTEKSYYIVVDDQPDRERTRTFVNDELSVVWNQDDRFTVFDNFVLGDEWVFMGEDGESAGRIEPVSEESESQYYVGVGDLDGFKYAVYPHRTTTEITTDGILTYFFPNKQYYDSNSFGFGRDANVMVSKTTDNKFRFKNVGGYLAFQLYGDDVSVSSLTLEGNHAEPLAGKSSIRISEGLPVVTMSQDNSATSSVELYCKEPVQLSSSSTEPTVFWFVLPTVTFSGGFKLTVKTSDDKVFQATTQRDLQIERSVFKSMAAIKVTPQTPTSGENVSLNGVSIVSVTNWDPSKNNPYTVKVDDQDERTFIITVPTVTDFSKLVLNYDVASGSVLVADGQEIENGVTAVDASKPVSLMVRNGNREQRYTLKARNTGLPVVRITTPADYSRVNIEAVPDHKDWFKKSFIRVEKANGELDFEMETQIKGRGNATWTYDKRPYALKLKDPGPDSVLGMNGNRRWILLANWKDRTLLRNDAAFWLSKQVSSNADWSSSFPYTVEGEFVELEFDGEHRGNYYLCEQIKLDKIPGLAEESAVSGPYMMEIDNNYDEEFRFKSGFYGKWKGSTFEALGLKYMFKDPDENISDEAKEYMIDFVQSMETLIKDIPNGNTGYRDYLDIDSAIWFMFINELTGNGDFFNTDSGNDQSSRWYGPHSTMLYKDRDPEDGTRSKLHFGPVWDFDYKTFISELETRSWGWIIQTEDRSHMWVGADSPYYYYYYLCKDSSFKDRMLALWKEYKSIITPTNFNDYIDGMARYIELSEEFNTEMWGYSGTDQDQNGDPDGKGCFHQLFHRANGIALCPDIGTGKDSIIAVDDDALC